MIPIDTTTLVEPPKPRKWYQILYVQVIIAIVLGILLGVFAPEVGEAMKPLGDAFIKLVKMIIAPVIFLTVVTGIAGMSNMKRVGRVAGKAMLAVLHYLFNLGIDHRSCGCQCVATWRGSQYRSSHTGNRERCG